MSEPTIEFVSEAVARWRKQGVRRLPASLWQDIFSLEKAYSLLEISQATGLQKQYLAKKLRKQCAGFVQVKIAAREPSPPTACEMRTVQVICPDGTQIRTQISGSEATEFLRKILP